MSILNKLKNQNSNKLGQYSLESEKVEIKKIKEILYGEECKLLISGFAFDRGWIIGTTDTRLIMVRKNLSKELDIKEYNIDDISEVIINKGAVLSKVYVTISNEKIKIENISNLFIEKFIESLGKETITEKEAKKRERDSLEQEKRKEFEKIMDSNPKITRNIKVTYEQPKVSKRKQEKEYQKERLEQLKRDKIPFCPKCKSTALTYEGKKLSVGRALVGGALLGETGAVLGGMSSKKGYVKCLNCGHKWKK